MGKVEIVEFRATSGAERIGSREKRNYSFDDVEAYKRLFSEPRPLIALQTYDQPRPFISKCSM